MPLDTTALVADKLAELIRLRFESRDAARKLTKSEKTKIRTVADLIVETGHDPMSTVKAFIDYMLSVSGKFKSPRNIYFEWTNFKAEHLSTLCQLFPVTDQDEDIFTAFQKDWKALSNDSARLRSVYILGSSVRPVKISKVYRGTPDFWRVIGLIRHYQPYFMQANFPLFTLRSFVAAQAEKLSSFIDRLQIGNLVSEKAHERYADWYDRRFYPAELVNRARKRPSENNPVCTSAIRREYELRRIESGSKLGVFTFAGEKALAFYDVPLIYENYSPSSEESHPSTSIVVPPSARE